MSQASGSNRSTRVHPRVVVNQVNNLYLMESAEENPSQDGSNSVSKPLLYWTQIEDAQKDPRNSAKDNEGRKSLVKKSLQPHSRNKAASFYVLSRDMLERILGSSAPEAVDNAAGSIAVQGSGAASASPPTGTKGGAGSAAGANTAGAGGMQSAATGPSSPIATGGATKRNTNPSLPPNVTGVKTTAGGKGTATGTKVGGGTAASATGGPNAYGSAGSSAVLNASAKGGTGAGSASGAGSGGVKQPKTNETGHVNPFRSAKDSIHGSGSSVAAGLGTEEALGGGAPRGTKKSIKAEDSQFPTIMEANTESTVSSYETTTTTTAKPNKKGTKKGKTKKGRKTTKKKRKTRKTKGTKRLTEQDVIEVKQYLSELVNDTDFDAEDPPSITNILNEQEEDEEERDEETQTARPTITTHRTKRGTKTAGRTKRTAGRTAGKTKTRRSTTKKKGGGPTALYQRKTTGRGKKGTSTAKTKRGTKRTGRGTGRNRTVTAAEARVEIRNYLYELIDNAERQARKAQYEHPVVIKPKRRSKMNAEGKKRTMEEDADAFILLEYIENFFMNIDDIDDPAPARIAGWDYWNTHNVTPTKPLRANGIFFEVTIRRVNVFHYLDEEAQKYQVAPPHPWVLLYREDSEKPAKRSSQNFKSIPAMSKSRNEASSLKKKAPNTPKSLKKQALKKARKLYRLLDKSKKSRKTKSKK